MSENEENLRRGLEGLNNLAHDDAVAALLKCCGSSRWASGMAAERPFDNHSELIGRADEVWWNLDERDWLEAFAAHPKIGEKASAPGGPTRAPDWSQEEQAATRDAASETLAELARANREYEEKFGYIFIVCATGKSTEEMLALLKGRMPNEPRAELRIAAGEQNKITRLRLIKLLTESV